MLLLPHKMLVLLNILEQLLILVWLMLSVNKKINLKLLTYLEMQNLMVLVFQLLIHMVLKQFYRIHIFKLLFLLIFLYLLVMESFMIISFLNILQPMFQTFLYITLINQQYLKIFFLMLLINFHHYLFLNLNLLKMKLQIYYKRHLKI